MAAVWETVVALVILFNVVALGLGVELARNLSKHSGVLQRLWATACRRYPQLCDGILKFVRIWDNFMQSNLDLESRFALFCDELGDYLEALVQRAVDGLEWLFQLDAAEQAAALGRVPRQRVSSLESKAGLGKLAVSSCAICFEDWKAGDDIR
ncbi:hypothetical protein N2152v2_004939 [Parachlorella kessleri]